MQSSSEQWFKECQNRITASNFRAIIKHSIYSKSLLAKVKNSTRHTNAPAPCKCGKDKEDNAIKAYRKFKHQKGKSVNICCKCGSLDVNSTSPWLGASPDFLVSDAC